VYRTARTIAGLRLGIGRSPLNVTSMMAPASGGPCRAPASFMARVSSLRVSPLIHQPARPSGKAIEVSAWPGWPLASGTYPAITVHGTIMTPIGRPSR
jgi:hypothetical protein